MQRTSLVALVTLLVLAAAPGRAITIEQAMADPDWIGPPVQQPYWSVDGRSLYYRVKQKGTPMRDLHRVDVADGKDSLRRCARRWRTPTAPKPCSTAHARAPRSCATATCSSATSPAAA